MPAPRSGSSARAVRRPTLRSPAFVALALVALFVLSSGAVPANGSPARIYLAAPANVHGGSGGLSVSAAPAASRSPAASGPLNISPTFFNNFWSAGNVSAANTSCGTFYCFQMSQNPTLLNLSNGDVGLGMSVVTNYTSAPTCASTNQVSRIAWAVSTDAGVKFSSYKVIGNTGTAACPYFQGLEPSFAVAPNGTIFAVFVAANATNAQMFAPSFSYGERPVIDYVYRPESVLVLISSSDNGSTWSDDRTILAEGNTSMPHLAIEGRTLYVVFTNLSNSTSVIPGANSDSSAVQFIDSTNGGQTWSSPVTLPGALPFSDPTQNNNTMAPSLVVEPSGTVMVAYAANRSCVAYCLTGFDTVYQDDIVVSTSTTNGTSWSRPVVVSRNASEFTDNFQQYTGPAVGQGVIDTSIAWGAGNHVYLAWAQSEPDNISDQYSPQIDWWVSGIDTAASSNAGVSWLTADVTGPVPQLDYNQQVFGFGAFNPAIAYHAGQVYLTYSYYNWTNGGSGYNAYLTNAFGLGNSQWETTSSDGVHWAPHTLVIYDRQGSGITDFDYWGYLASILFNATGAPVIAYPLQTDFLNYVPPLFVGQIAMVVATPYAGPTSVVTIKETGLAPGTNWSAEVQGYAVNTALSEFNVTDAPTGMAISVVWPGPPIAVGYRALVMPEITYAPTLVAAGATTDVFDFTTFYGLEWNVNPLNTPSFYLYNENFNANGGYEFYWTWSTYLYAFGSFFTDQGVPMPWYFPAGSWLNYSSGYCCNSYYYGSGFVGYWSGTGAGSFTGSGATARLHMLGPINETAWMAAFGYYNESFSAPNLPSTSQFQFSVDNATYSGAGGGSVVVGNLGTGAHLVTDITANSSQAGYTYFGYPTTGNPVIVPNVPSVDLAFADVDLASAAGQVTYHAVGLPTGSAWQLSFNGTDYSSATPWINVTARDGQYPVLSYPTVASSGNQTFVPSSIGSGGSVVVGQTYAVNFTSTYAVQLQSSAGGTINLPVGRSFYAPGATVSLTATPASGFRFGGWYGTGTGSYSGGNLSAMLTVNGPIDESAGFVPLVPNRFNVTVNETGLPAGTSWSVVVGGVGYAATTASLNIPNEYSCTFSGNQGRYTLAVPYAHANNSGARFVPSSPPSTVCGGGAAAVINFIPQYAVSVTASTGGTVTVTPSSSPSISSPYWVPSGGTVTLVATPLLGYTFGQWIGAGAGSYSGTAATPTPITVGGPITEVAEFTPVAVSAPEQYNATFTASPALATGTLWTVSNATASFSSSGATLVVPHLSPGSYSFSVGTAQAPDASAQYTPTSPLVKVTVVGADVASTITFNVAYWVAISAAGPGTVSPSSRFVASGVPLALGALADSGATFLGWTGTGPGAYTGSNPTPTVTPTGAVHEVASFESAPASTTNQTSNANPGLFASPIVWGLLGVVGLIVGIVIGLMLVRRRPPAADPARPVLDEPPAEPGEPSSDGGTP